MQGYAGVDSQGYSRNFIGGPSPALWRAAYKFLLYVCLACTLRGEAKEVRHSWYLTSPTSTVDHGVSQWLSAAAALSGRDSGELMNFMATDTKTSGGLYVVKPMAT